MSGGSMDGARWMVCTTHLRQEKLALENLQRQAFEGYLPMMATQLKPRGQPVRTLIVPFFPRYIFVKVDMARPGWTALYSTRGIVGLLPASKRGVDLLGHLVEDIRKREVKGLVELTPGEMPCLWKAGDQVSYWVYREAIFQERIDERRCRILVSGVGGRDSLQIVDLADLE